MNALSPNLFRELHETFEDFRKDPDLRVGIITGAGEKAFGAGADVKEWLPFVKECRAEPWLLLPPPLKEMEVLKPLIVAINGVALWGRTGVGPLP